MQLVAAWEWLFCKAKLQFVWGLLLVEALFQAQTGHCVCQAWVYLMVVVTVQVPIYCCLYQTWGSLTRGTGHTMDSHWGLWMDLQAVEWGRVPGNHQGRTMVLARLMESSDLVPTYAGLGGWVGGGLNKGPMVSASTSIPGRELSQPLLF